MKERKIKRAAAMGLFLAFVLCGCGSENENEPAVMGDIIEGSVDMPESQQDVQNETVSNDPFTMLFTGDIQMGSNITAAYDRAGLNGILSEELKQQMINADITMVNEEFPFGTGGTKAPDKQFTFKTDPAYVKMFQESGVDIVSLANNHVLDFGPDVLSQTFETLDQAGISYVGAGETLERASACETIEVNGTKVGFLCASRVIPVVEWDVRNSQPGVFTTYDPQLLVEQIGEARKENDLVVVYVHWGIEKAEVPEEYQKVLAHAYIDAGADLVIGSHPHVLQGIEYYKDVPIVYSLGNFMFNPTIEKTVVLKVTVDENQKLALQMIPAAASDSKTSDLTGERGQAVLNYMEQISFDIEVDENGVITPDNQ